MAGTGTGEPVSVPSRGLTALDRKNLGIVLALSPVGVLVTVFLTNGGPGHLLVAKILLAAAALAIWYMCLTALISVRRLDVDPKGVTLHFLFRQERGAWSQVNPHSYYAPPKVYYYERGSWPLLIQSGSGLRRRYITQKQALAILQYPTRPPFDLTGPPWEALARRIGALPS